MAADTIATAGRPRLATVPAPAEVIDRFRATLAARDIVPPKSIIADGSIHRCDAAGRNGKGDAAYLFHLDVVPAGGLENWRDGKGWERSTSASESGVEPTGDAAPPAGQGRCVQRSA